MNFDGINRLNLNCLLKVLDVKLDTQIGSINSNFTKYVHTNLFTDHLHIAEKENEYL